MAWYDNLQYPDYARHYENQGKMYSDLLNSLSKIGGEYLTQQREVKAGKDFETAKRELRDKNTTQVPAVAEQPFSAGSRYIPAVQGYQPPQIGIGEKYHDYPMDEAIMSSPAVEAREEIPYRAAVPASTNFNQTGYDKGLLDLLSRMYTGGDKIQKNLATEAITMYELQDKIRKAGQSTFTTEKPTENVIETDQYGNRKVIKEGVQEPKGVMLIDQKTGQTQFFPYGSPIPAGFVPTTAYNTGQNVAGRKEVVGMNIKSRENIAEQGRKLQLLITGINNKTSISNDESRNIQSGINNLRNSLTSRINSLNDDKIEAGKYSNSEAEIAAINTEIDEYKNQLNSLNIDEGMLINKNKPKSGSGGKTSSNPLNINMNPKK